MSRLNDYGRWRKQQLLTCVNNLTICFLPPYISPRFCCSSVNAIARAFISNFQTLLRFTFLWFKTIYVDSLLPIFYVSLSCLSNLPIHSKRILPNPTQGQKGKTFENVFTLGVSGGSVWLGRGKIGGGRDKMFGLVQPCIAHETGPNGWNDVKVLICRGLA